METIKFSTNWNNKLNCKFYTTLRLVNYKYQIGKVYQVELKGKTLHKVQIADIKIFGINDINSYVAGLDTGYTVGETKKILRTMYKEVNWETQRLALILLQVITDEEAQLFQSK